MAFHHAGGGDLDEPGLLQLADVARAGVSHAGPESADHLVDHFREAPLEGYPSDDAFRYQFLDVVLHILEIAVLGPFLHGFDGSHPTVGLEFPSFEDDGLARRFIHPCEEGAGHDGIGTCGDGFDDVARVADPAVGDHGDAGALEGLRHIIDGCQLGYAHPGDDAGGANRPGADPYFDGIHADTGQVTGSLCRTDVANHERKPGEGLFHLPGHVHHPFGMAVGCIDHHGIHLRIHQGLHPGQGVPGDAHGSGNTQAAALVLAGVGPLLDLYNVLVGDQPDKLIFFVHHRQLLDLVFLQDVGSLFEVSELRGGDQVRLGHHIVDGLLRVALKAQVAVGDDAHEDMARIHDRDAADAIFIHDLEGVADECVLADGYGVQDHAVLRPLHFAHLVGLVLDGHVLVDHADAAFLGNGNGHGMLGHRVHGSRHHRDVEGDAAGELCTGIHLPGKYLTVCRKQQDIIVGETFLGKFIFIVKHVSGI